MKLNEPIIRKWIKALRSGEYEQTIHTLRRHGAYESAGQESFCCLGVLCNIHAQMHPDYAATQKDYRFYDTENGTLGPNVKDWSGVDSDFCEILIDLNDSEKKTFKQIAGFLSRTLKDQA